VQVRLAQRDAAEAQRVVDDVGVKARDEVLEVVCRGGRRKPAEEDVVLDGQRYPEQPRDATALRRSQSRVELARPRESYPSLAPEDPDVGVEPLVIAPDVVELVSDPLLAGRTALSQGVVIFRELGL
jgi:hypothetical protein